MELINNRPDPVAVQRTYEQYMRTVLPPDPYELAIQALRARSAHLSMLIALMEAEQAAFGGGS